MERLNITTAGTGTIIGGKFLSTFIRGWLQVVFLIAFGAFVLGISWGNSLGATSAVVCAFLLAATGLGLLLSSIVKTNSQLGAYGTIVLMVSTMLSGCWWPIEMQPEFMQKMAVIFPQYWAMEGFKNTVVSNLGFSSVVDSVLALLLMAGIFIVLTFIMGGFRVFSVSQKADASVVDE